MERSALTISLYASDVAAAIAFYVDELGFHKTGSWPDEDGNPIWGEVARDGPKGTARIWFYSGNIEDRAGPAMTGLVYLFVDDVKVEADRLSDRVTRRWGPKDQEYGLRELGIEDLNGYLICFAQDL
ncbi:MAG: catechol 2,3-dioxygenase-like lactoylglutathione lyase family enzyme [Hyphomicrobiaceae bacterium]|jgi:catechol 2,3-dioxygenase-like lactoylglutathione lyase family enzyme